MFYMLQYVAWIYSVRNRTLLYPFVPTSQTIIQVGLLTIIIHNDCVSAADIFNEFGIQLLCKFGSLCIYFLKFLLVFYCYSTFELFYVIYILFGCNHISMLINPPIKGIDWRFSEIVTLAIISCEPSLNRYT